MRILHVSKFREVTGGVESHMHALVNSQRRSGHEAEIFASDFRAEAMQLEPDETSVLESARTAARIIWSDDARRALRRRIRDFAPDVVHFHSVYHQLSASVLHAVPQSCPTVMTLHDYKLAAPCYTLLRDGMPCTACVGGVFPSPAIRHRCVKGSRGASLVCATEQVLHARSYRTRIDRFLTPSHFSAGLLARSRAVPADRIAVVPHGVELPPATGKPSRSRRFVFIGRLAPEKGIRDLLEAWDLSGAGQLGFDLEVVGDGPESNLLDQHPDTVHRRGWVTGAAIQSILQHARAVLMPSRFHETFGLAGAEALAAGVPLLASRAGALPELVEASNAGALFDVGDVRHLARLVAQFADDRHGDAIDALGRAGRRYAEENLEQETMAVRTMEQYRRVGATHERPSR